MQNARLLLTQVRSATLMLTRMLGAYEQAIDRAMAENRDLNADELRWVQTEQQNALAAFTSAPASGVHVTQQRGQERQRDERPGMDEGDPTGADDAQPVNRPTQPRVFGETGQATPRQNPESPWMDTATDRAQDR